MRPIVVSFYTVGTGYESEAREMEATARAFGLVTDVRPVPNLGDWVHNCAMKPAFIRDRMQDYPGKPIVWLDADARVRQKPELFDAMANVDLACHYRHGVELLSGTLYLGATPGAKVLVDAWCAAQLLEPWVWDQRILQRVVESSPDVVVRELPASYVRVFDDPKMGEPVIEHTQASRRLAKAV